VVGSSHKVAAVRELGADEVIDKSKQDLWATARSISPEGYHVIFDANGVETLKQRSVFFFFLFFFFSLFFHFLFLVPFSFPFSFFFFVLLC